MLIIALTRDIWCHRAKIQDVFRGAWEQNDEAHRQYACYHQPTCIYCSAFPLKYREQLCLHHGQHQGQCVGTMYSLMIYLVLLIALKR